MLVCRLKKDGDAVFFVHEIGKIVDLTLIALHLVYSLRTDLPKSAENEEFKSQIIELPAFLYFSEKLRVLLLLQNMLSELNDEHKYELYAHGLCQGFFRLSRLLYR